MRGTGTVRWNVGMFVEPGYPERGQKERTLQHSHAPSLFHDKIKLKFYFSKITIEPEIELKFY